MKSILGQSSFIISLRLVSSEELAVHQYNKNTLQLVLFLKLAANFTRSF